MKFQVLMAILLMPTGISASPKIGQPAPEFTLKGHDGREHSLKEHKGKFVVLEWFNNECPYVEKHYHEKKRNMQTLQKNWPEIAKKKNKQLVWFVISSSAPGKQGHLTKVSAKKIKDQHRQAHMKSILLDQEGKVGRLYAAKTTPHMYIIDPTGVLVYKGAIDDQPSARLSSLDGAKNYVAQSLEKLLASQPIPNPSTTAYGCSVKY